MGRLLSLLKAAAGERSLSGRIGAWRVAVSQALDNAAAQQYNQVRRTIDQSFAAAGDVIFDDVPTPRISNGGAGIFTIDPSDTVTQFVILSVEDVAAAP